MTHINFTNLHAGQHGDANMKLNWVSRGKLEDSNGEC